MRMLNTRPFPLAMVIACLGIGGLDPSLAESPKKALPVDRGQFETATLLIDGSPATIPDPGQGDPQCLGLQVDATSKGPLFADSFESGNTAAWESSEMHLSAGHVIDLRFRVNLESGFAGDHALHLRLTTPKGHHYQTLSVPIAGVPTAQGQARRVEGFPRAMPVQAPAARDPNLIVELKLPVAGTPILGRALLGRWKVEALIDNAVQPCLEPTYFVLSR